MAVKLIADSGSTKCEWCLLSGGKKKLISTQGISPYFLSADQIVALLQKELLPKLKAEIDEVYYYGTGLGSAENVAILKKVLRKLFPGAKVEATHDLMGAARALCGDDKGIACILGTGSNSCFYNGKKIVKNSPGLGYVLGDEGSGTYLGKKVIQYYLYNTFDEDLKARFDARFTTTPAEILENVYKKPLPNRYLAAFTIFLAENRGHYMVENIIEDGLNDFFFNHLYKYRESWSLPIHFTGSVAYGFRDVLKELCQTYELELGKVLQKPMDGLVSYHK
ncbi:BadF/BadG/BcrA/BcrD ATPase family protein [Deminuibacter soli]|uniref:N-acetylglucosamine kinase n=1 Tax=Deminuibacter soli TaxID=2291815 RepID=A0A3E1NLX9_9BACT|nr:BadF/BadG/BcrA/BcrD ATPase family protein [Deminuibacter soli]RFM28936.1 N-acetylglucosamine kinase [Deminuibacter soli]